MRRRSIGDFSPEFRDSLCRLFAQVPDLCKIRCVSKEWRGRVQEVLEAALISRLSQKGSDGRRSAVYALGRIASKDEPDVVAAVASRLGDHRDAVRLAAVSVLPDLVKRGDREVFDVVAVLLDSDDWRMREAALDALGAVARIGDKEAISTVTARLRDAESPVRMAAIRALTEIAPKGDAGVIAMVSSRLEDPDASMRQAALSALARVVDKADKRMIIAIGDRMHDNEQWQIRQTAVNTLSQLAEKGDPMVIGAVTSRLKDCDWPVRGAAVAALVKVSDDDDEGLIGILLELLQDCAPYVRCAVANVLAEIAEEDDEPEVIAALRARIEGAVAGTHETHAMVRRTIAEALESLGEGTVEALLRLAEDRAAIGSVSEETPSIEAQERWNEEKHPAAKLAKFDESARQEENPTGSANDAPAVQIGQSQASAKPKSTGWMTKGMHCSHCSKKVSVELGGVVCQRRGKDGSPISGCGKSVCWRCMAKAPRDTFGTVRTSKEEFEGWGAVAWWMHERCMTDADWALYSGEGGDTQGHNPSVFFDFEESAPSKEASKPTDTKAPDQVHSVRQAQDTSNDGKTNHSAESVKRMSVKQLKEFLSECAVACSDCVEKADLVARALKTVELMSSAEQADSAVQTQQPEAVEDSDKTKNDEDEKKRDAESKIRREQHATLAMVQVLQELSKATPENLTELTQKLDEVIRIELPETGAQQEILKAESQRVRDYAKQSVEQTIEKKKNLEEKDAEEEKPKPKTAAEWKRILEEEESGKKGKKTNKDGAKKSDENEEIRRQQHATLAVVQVLQGLSKATPENFTELTLKLGVAMQKELPATGAQQETLKAECERVHHYAKQIVKQTIEERKKAEDSKMPGVVPKSAPAGHGAAGAVPKSAPAGPTAEKVDVPAPQKKRARNAFDTGAAPVPLLE